MWKTSEIEEKGKALTLLIANSGHFDAVFRHTPPKRIWNKSSFQFYPPRKPQRFLENGIYCILAPQTRRSFLFSYSKIDLKPTFARARLVFWFLRISRFACSRVRKLCTRRRNRKLCEGGKSTSSSPVKKIISKPEPEKRKGIWKQELDHALITFRRS